MFIQIPPEINAEMASVQQKKNTRRHPSFWKNARNYFSEYTSSTSLHGLQYLGDQKRSKFERILWLVIISASLSMCIFLISKTYKKWDTTPVIVSFAHNPTPVWKVPFPAVTICTETKTRSRIYNFTDNYQKYENEKTNLTDLDLKQLGDASLICEPSIDGNFTTDEDLFKFLEMAAPSKDNVLLICASMTFESCTSEFSTVLIDDGICYSYNSLDRDDIYTSEVYHSTNFLNHQNNVTDWSMEKGYAKSASKNAYPRRTMSAGIEGGLQLILMAYKENIDYFCRGPTQGFKILLHHPGEIAQMRMQNIRIPYDEDVTIAVKTDVIKTSNRLRNYDPHKRGCYFTDERQLGYYKNYTQQNCLMECLTNYTLKRCECVSFFMPRQNTTNICGPKSKQCLVDARSEIYNGNAMSEFNVTSTDTDCDCLPSCTTLIYNAETTQTDFNWRKYLKLRNPELNFSDLAEVKMSSVSIFFKERQFITSERNELYGITDFLANCGGLLGLFIGFSLLSFVEILYFLTIRLGINWRKYGRHYWSASDDILQNEMYGYEKQSV